METSVTKEPNEWKLRTGFLLLRKFYDERAFLEGIGCHPPCENQRHRSPARTSVSPSAAAGCFKLHPQRWKGVACSRKGRFLPFPSGKQGCLSWPTDVLSNLILLIFDSVYLKSKPKTIKMSGKWSEKNDANSEIIQVLYHCHQILKIVNQLIYFSNEVLCNTVNKIKVKSWWIYCVRPS